MKRFLPLAALVLASPLIAQEGYITPASVIARTSAEEWQAIPSEDLLVMDLAPDREGVERRVVIQLMSPPFSQGWVENIRKLAGSRWWDGTSIYRVQDNYVVQWGDVTEKKALPEGVQNVAQSAYVVTNGDFVAPSNRSAGGSERIRSSLGADSYAERTRFVDGWAIAMEGGGPETLAWPVHCYGAVGVARSVEDTGMGSDLYAVIGHAPRQLDRNIAVVGRVIEGIEHLSVLPRGKGELGFYEDSEADKRVPILSVRLGSELPDPPLFEYLSTDSESFAKYAHSRANRQDDFYQVPAGGVDVCNVPVPVRRATAAG